MYCPNCGSEERQISQFCRACGKDLRAVRSILEKPDAITASAISARDEIGRAIADKIREVKKGSELQKLTEEVLPEIEKFLESPQERRLRGIRSGVVTTMLGVGASVFFLLMGLAEHDSRFLIGLGVTAFLIGIGLIINALLFTVPKEHMTDQAARANYLKFLNPAANSVSANANLSTAEPLVEPTSVTEQTTHHLSDSAPAPGRIRESGSKSH